MVTTIRSTTIRSGQGQSFRAAESALVGSGVRGGGAMVGDFQLLGLRPREARIEVIRQAVRKAANEAKAAYELSATQPVGQDSTVGVPLSVAAEPAVVQSPEQDSPAEEPAPETLDDQRLARVAAAGYHLLDPRRRRTLFERVQLLMWSEEELDPDIQPWWDRSPADGPRPRVAARPAQNPVAPPVAPPVALDARLTTQAEEMQAALELFRNLRQRDRRAQALWIGVIGLALSLSTALWLAVAFL